MWRLWRRWRARREGMRARMIFEYHDGVQWRYGDPFALWRSLLNHPTFNMADHLPAVDRGEEPETTLALDAITEVFGICRLDSHTGKGLTDGQTLDLLLSLSRYLEELKKKRRLGPTSSSPMDGGCSTATEPQDATTPCSADLADASTGPNYGGAGES